jgi:ribosomal protein L7/L12
LELQARKQTMNDELDSVVFDGIRFLESITRYYGAERGMAAWEKMGEAFGEEIKGRVFFAMLTGDSVGRVRFTSVNCSQAVWAIKAIRAATGYGLKEAKDLFDLAKIKTVAVDVKTPNERRELIKCLRDAGCSVN